jgi:hypothetical protein
MLDPGYNGVAAGIERCGEREDEAPVRAGTSECDDGVKELEEKGRVGGFWGVD